MSGRLRPRLRRYSELVTPTLAILRVVARHNLTVAVPFWGAWLVLAIVEATVGSNALLGIVFLLTLPLLVGFVTWSSLHLLLVLNFGNRVVNIVVLGVAVLLSSTIITGIGLTAAASLKSLLSP